MQSAIRTLVWGLAFALVCITAAHSQESGYQIINGTRVFTQIDHASDTATFSNDCGSQTISHRDLGNGAIPSQIIPCPRPNASSNNGGSSDAQKADHDQAVAEHQAFLLREAQQYYAEAQQDLKDYNVGAAASAFLVAKGHYAELGDKAMAAKAEHYAIFYKCMYDLYLASVPSQLENMIKSCPSSYIDGVAKNLLDAIDGDRPALEIPINVDPPSYGCSDETSLLIAAPPTTCGNEVSGWNQNEPYNHGPRTIVLFPARGRTLFIAPRQGLQRLPDGSLMVSVRISGMSLEGQDSCRNLDLSYGALLFSCEMDRETRDHRVGAHTEMMKARKSADAQTASSDHVWAALTPNNEANSQVVWGATKEEAIARSLAACRQVSSTCPDSPTYTDNLSMVGVIACCTNPKLGCVSQFAGDLEGAKQEAQNNLSRNGYSSCQIGQTFKASNGLSAE